MNWPKWAGTSLLTLCLLGTKTAFSLEAAEEQDFSGNFHLEAGGFQPPGGSVQAYQYSALLLEGQKDLFPSFSFGWAGEAHWQASTSALGPSWPLYPVENYISLEANRLLPPGPDQILSLRLSRAYGKWVSGRLEATAGLQAFAWGSAYFYRPTDYFFPLPPLAWDGERSLGSEALDVSCFLFDDLHGEYAVRLLEGGETEWVARLVNKGIALTVAPSFARLRDKNGLGMESLVTFPDFQARLEGTAWFFPGGAGGASPALCEWVAGISTVKDSTRYNLEVFRDGTGAVLGNESTGSRDNLYLFASAEKDFPGKWKVNPGLVKALEGRSWLLWPKASFAFYPGWEADFQGQIMVLGGSGPLALNPSRMGLSVSYGF